ncbi:MAG: helix-turn-helix domain-containing protein [Eubacteriales bacterium]
MSNTRPDKGPYLSYEEIEKLQRGWENLIKPEDPYGHPDPDEESYRKRIAECASFPDHVKAFRLAYGWNMMHLSDLVECSEMHIRHLEHGRRKPSYKMFLKLADAFGVDRDALLDEDLFEDALEHIREKVVAEEK